MMKIRWLLPLMLLFCAAPSKAVNPYWTNQCNSPRENINIVGTVSCHMANVVAGRTIIIDASGVTTITVTATETPTCPAGALGSGGWFIQKCYVVLASSHADFVVTNTSGGAFSRVFGISAREYPGLGAFDTSCGSGTQSCTLTTANSGEWLDVGGVSLANDIAPHAGFNPQQYGMMAGDTSGQAVRTANWYQVTGGAGSQTAQYDSTNANAGFTATSALAFQISSPPPLPSVVIVQTCTYAYPDTTRSSFACPIHNYTANHMVAWGWSSTIQTLPVGCIGTNCSCPINSTIFHVYSGTSWGSGVCAGFDPSNQSVSSWGIALNFGSGQSIQEAQVLEISGTVTSIDAGSEAATNALSVNYSTAGSNEYTVTACLDNSTNPLSPGGAAIQGGNTTDVDTSLFQTQLEVTTQVTAASGSHTTSCSMTGSTIPMIATLSFGISASPSVPRKKGWIDK